MLGSMTHWNRWQQRANLLANEVGTTSLVGPEPFRRIRMSTSRELMDRQKKLKATLWENLPSLRQSNLFLENVDK